MENANNTNEGNVTIALDENGFIPGTNYKSIDEFVKGLGELKTKFDAQGNELGQVRAQAKTLAETLKETLTKSKQTDSAPDFNRDIAAAQEQLKKLDPMDENFSVKQAELVGKITDLKADKVKNAVLGEAGKLFQEELKNRDVQASQKAFLDQNPSFNTPEMQARIDDFMAKDRTGMHDKMSAFFALLAQDSVADRDRLAKEHTEMQKALDLQKGKDTTGKVIVKGVNPDQATNQPQLKGKDLDSAMAAALAKARGE